MSHRTEDAVSISDYLYSTMTPKSKQKMENSPVSLDDFEVYARKFLPRNALDYYRSGANDQVTLSDNLKSFQRHVIAHI